MRSMDIFAVVSSRDKDECRAGVRLSLGPVTPSRPLVQAVSFEQFEAAY